MEVYNSILTVANQIGWSPDSVLSFSFFALMCFLGSFAFFVDFMFDAGSLCYKLLKRFVFWIFDMCKKKEP